MGDQGVMVSTNENSIISFTSVKYAEKQQAPRLLGHYKETEMTEN